MENNDYANLATEINYKSKAENSDKPAKMKQSSFTLKEQNGGNILTVHHTIKEQNKLLRIVLSVCCFDLRGTHMVAIDKRGGIFVFNFNTKRNWRLNEKVKKPSVAVASRRKHNQYFIGTKEGFIALMDVDLPHLVKQSKISDEPINEISFPGQPLEPNNIALICASCAALLIDLDTFNCSYRLDFDKVILSLKFASFMPNSDHIMTAFTNDTLHIWSGVSLEVVRILHPIKMRDKKLKFQEEGKTDVLELNLHTKAEEEIKNGRVMSKFLNKNLTDGIIITYAYKIDSSAVVLSTWDNFLLILSIYTFEMIRLYHLKDFILLQIAALSKPYDEFILGLTDQKTVVLLDCENVEYKLKVDLGPSRYITISLDNKYLAVSQISGEVNVWSVGHLLAVIKSQKKCLSTLRNAYKQKKSIKIASNENEGQFQEELKKLLTPQRLKQILQEYHCYPAKYRFIIWCSLLQLPHNRNQYQELLQMGEHAEVARLAKTIQIKNSALKKSLLKCWSCLAHWCKVLAHCEMLPGLIFPFVKVFPQNPLTAFEICCTLIQNQFQLFFEYHPLEPANYLGICCNLLQHFDTSLYEFYLLKEVPATIFAWSLLKTAFSEVLDQDQWLCLWDNVLSAAPYYLCFVTVAYNMLLKDVIMRLPDKNVIEIFFKEQNPLDINKLIAKAFKLLNKCPGSLHPQIYFTPFQSIPSNVYPKFLKYPQKCFNQYKEKVEDLRNVHAALDERMRELELEELQLMQRLEQGLRQEEHSKRMKEIDAIYQNTLKREEERINCQRKMLLLYQKEIRQRKGQVMAALQDSCERKEILQRDRELQFLQNHIENERSRNDLNLMWAEEELHSQDMELLTQKLADPSFTLPLRDIYFEDLKQLYQGQELLNSNIQMITSLNEPTAVSKSTKVYKNNLDDLERKLDKIQKEFQLLARTT